MGWWVQGSKWGLVWFMVGLGLVGVVGGSLVLSDLCILSAARTGEVEEKVGKEGYLAVLSRAMKVSEAW